MNSTFRFIGASFVNFRGEKSEQRDKLKQAELSELLGVQAARGRILM